jgi:hypothetical protein
MVVQSSSLKMALHKGHSMDAHNQDAPSNGILVHGLKCNKAPCHNNILKIKGYHHTSSLRWQVVWLEV